MVISCKVVDLTVDLVTTGLIVVVVSVPVLARLVVVTFLTAYLGNLLF